MELSELDAAFMSYKTSEISDEEDSDEGNTVIEEGPSNRLLIAVPTNGSFELVVNLKEWIKAAWRLTSETDLDE